MKTVQELIETLNCYFRSEFDLFDKGCGDVYLTVDGYPVVRFNQRAKQFGLRAYIQTLSGKCLFTIIDFLANSNPDDWFAEKKYYIAVGMYDSTSKLIYYKNGNELDFKLRTMMDFDEKHLQEDDIFTENEIEELKSTLSEQMAKIVDLGKVEVKDD